MDMKHRTIGSILAKLFMVGLLSEFVG
jgi:hypothetical protein